MISFSTALCYADRFCDYIPILSTISNLLPKLTFCIMQGTQSSLNNRYIRHISAKSSWRCGIAAIPFIGNIAIAIFDAANILAANNRHELVNKNANFIKGTLNQYTQLNDSACTRYACLFLTNISSFMTPESIDRLLCSLPYGSYREQHEDTEKVIEDFPNLLLQNNPFLDSKIDIQVSNDPTQELRPEHIMNYLINEENIDGALITCMGTTIAVRKQEHMIEFFDSHGDRNITGKGAAAAYVYRCNPQEATDFLMHKFPLRDDIVNTVCFWLLQITR